jgi:hypothetical protein
MALPAPGTLAGGMQLCPVFECIAAIKAQGWFNNEFGGRPHALLNMGQMEEDLLDGHVQFRGKLLHCKCPFG